MKYNAPYGSTDQNASYVNGTPTSRGSVIPAGAIEDPQREIINAIVSLGLTPSSNDKTQLARGILTQSLEYSNTIDYDKPRIVIVNNTLYVWQKPNGPATTVVNPSEDTNGTYWKKYDPAPPDSTSLTAGLVKLSDSLESTENADTGKTAATPAAVKLLHDIIINLEVVLAEFQRQLIVESDVLTRYQINLNARSANIENNVFPGVVELLNERRKSQIGSLVQFPSSTLPDEYRWPDGSIALFSEYPEFYKKYQNGDLDSVILPYNSTTEIINSNPGKFRLNSDSTGVYLPNLTSKVLVSWTNSVSGSDPGSETQVYGSGTLTGIYMPFAIYMGELTDGYYDNLSPLERPLEIDEDESGDTESL